MNKDELINKALACFKMTVDVKGLNQLEKYISDIEEKNKRLKDEVNSLNKGLRKLSSKRDKWKDRYYKEKTLHEYDERAVKKQCVFIDKHYTQQKEFIKWLENMLDDEYDIFSVARVKDVLSKYKEITGKNE
ncbi:MAG: hypothetical protein J6B89_03540 [Bacilli bacterium]|nr:hypothetical protein [Bacilli bacterium]